MSHPFPLQTLLPDATSPSLPTSPNRTSSSNNPYAMRQQWEESARSWLSSLPDHIDPSASDIDIWIDSNLSSIPKDIRSLPRCDLHRRILSLRFIFPVHSQSQLRAKGIGHAEFPYRFQRTDQWRPVYSWLESVDKDIIVNSKEITDWLSLNTEFRDALLARHSKYHLMHYIQKLHLKLLKKKGKLPKDQNSEKTIGTAKEISRLYYFDEMPSWMNKTHGLGHAAICCKGFSKVSKWWCYISR